MGSAYLVSHGMDCRSRRKVYRGSGLVSLRVYTSLMIHLLLLFVRSARESKSHKVSSAYSWGHVGGGGWTVFNEVIEENGNWEIGWR